MKKNTHILYGLLTAAVMVITGTIIIASGAYLMSGLAYLVYIPFVAGILLNAVAYSKANGGNVTFGNIFLSCFYATLIVLAVRVAWIPVSNHFFPAVKERAFAKMQEHIAANPGLSGDQAETAINIASKVWIYGVVIGLIFSTLFFGALFSLIGAAVAKKNVVVYNP